MILLKLILFKGALSVVLFLNGHAGLMREPGRTPDECWNPGVICPRERKVDEEHHHLG